MGGAIRQVGKASDERDMRFAINEVFIDSGGLLFINRGSLIKRVNVNEIGGKSGGRKCNSVYHRVLCRETFVSPCRYFSGGGPIIPFIRREKICLGVGPQVSGRTFPSVGINNCQRKWLSDLKITLNTRICRADPGPTIVPHLTQLIIKNPVRTESEKGSEPYEEHGSLLARGAFAILSTLLFALGGKMFSNSVDAGRYSVPNSLWWFVAGLVLFAAAGITLFLLALNLPALHPH